MKVDVHDLAQELLKTYRLQPDRRLSLALAALYNITTGRPAPHVASDFREGRWHFLADSEDVGDLPEIPDYEESTQLLAAWAARLARPAATGGQAGASATTTVGRGLDPLALMKALGSLPAPCRGGACAVSLLHREADGFVWLSLTSADSLQQADALYGRAWALVALEKALAPSEIGDHEALLAEALGYETAAMEAARRLDPAGVTRAFVERDEARLASSCGELSPDPGCSYLQLWLAAVASDETRFSSLWNRLPLSDRRSLPMLALRVKLGAFDAGPEPGHALASQVFEAVRSPSLWSRWLSRGKAEGATGSFESAVARTARRLQGGVLDEGSISGCLRGNFYSGLHDEAVFYLDRLSSDSDARAFAKAMEKPAAGTASELREWVELRAQILSGSTNVQPLSDAVASMRSVGATPLSRIAYTIRYYAPSTEPLHRRSMPELFAMLDSRPLYLSQAADLSWDSLTSPLFYTRYAGAAAREAPFLAERLVGTAALFDADAPRLRSVAEDETASFYTRTEALAALDELGQADDAYLRDHYRKLVEEDVDGMTIDSFIWYLSEKKDTAAALSALERYLQRRPGTHDLAWAHLVTEEAQLLSDLGETAKAFSVIEPAVPTGKEEVLEQAASVAISLGKTREGRELAEEGRERYPDEEDFPVLLVKLRWATGDYAGAAKELAEFESSHKWTYFAARSFGDVFSKRSDAEATQAFAALRKTAIPAHLLGDVAIALGKKGKVDLATKFVELIRDPAPEWDQYIRLATYDLIKDHAGAESAWAWLHRAMPAPHDDFALSLYQSRKYELIWDFFPPSNGGGEKRRVVRLVKAASLLHLKETESPRRDELLAELAADPDQGDFMVRCALFLLGKRDSGAILRPMKELADAASIGWAMGVKLASEGRFEEAEPWLQVALESGQSQEPPNAWAFVILSDWLQTHRSLAVLAKTGKF